MENLINIALVKYLAMEFGVTEITITKSERCLAFKSFNAFSDTRLMEGVEKSNGKAYLSVSLKPAIAFKRQGKDNAEMLFLTRKFLENCHLCGKKL